MDQARRRHAGPTVSYCRSGGGRSDVAEEEWLSIDMDEFKARRATGVSVVGHFGGTLTADEAARVTSSVAACEAAEPAHPPIPRPGATTVQIDIDSTSVHYQSGSPPPGRWERLDHVLRDLCDAIVDRPTAAIAIEATDDGTALVHRGRDPITVDLTNGTFVAIAYTGGEKVGRSEGALEGGRETAEPGWTKPIPIGRLPGSDTVGDTVGEPSTVHVIARFTIGELRHSTPVKVAFTPAFERPH